MTAPELIDQLDTALANYTAGIDRAVKFVTIDQVDMLAEFYLQTRRADLATIDPAAIREAAMREAALIAQNYHMNALEWAKKIRGLEKHIGETDSLRIANDILALIGKANSMIGEKK